MPSIASVLRVARRAGRPRLTIGICITVALASPSCGSRTRNDADSPPAPAQEERFSSDELAVFDRVTASENVITDPRVRNLYGADPPSTSSGSRQYAFVLKPQPGMVEGTHFQVVTVTWRRNRPGAPAAPESSGGPGGSFVTSSATTSDGKYRIEVTRGERLPATVTADRIDTRAIAQGLADAYRTGTRK